MIKLKNNLQNNKNSNINKLIKPYTLIIKHY